MERSGYLDLYVTEAEEYMQTLHEGLVTLGQEAGRSALEEAFRAAHTLKGMSALMGYHAVEARARELEDRLEGVKDGRVDVDDDLIEELLAGADSLERLITESVEVETSGEPSVAEEGQTAGTAESSDDVPAACPGSPAPEPRSRREPPPAGTPPAAHVEGGRPQPVEAVQLDALAAGVGELTTLRARLAEFATTEAWEEFADALERVSRLTRDLQTSVLSVRVVPIAEIFDGFPGVVHDHARSLCKDVAFRTEGGDIELDRLVLDALAEPLLRLLENGLEHGLENPDARRAAGKPEKGSLLLRAERGPATVRIEVADDGQGVAIDRVMELARLTGLTVAPGRPGEPLTSDELLRLLSRPGFSTAPAAAGCTRYGVGLDRVATRVHRLGGNLEMHTVRGEGARFTIELPLTSPLMRALRVRVGGEEYAIPLTNVADVLKLDEAMITRVQGEESLRVRDRLVPLVRLAKTLASPTGAGPEATAVLVHVGAQRYALAVHESGGEEQIVVRGFVSPVGTLPIFSGAALLSDGRPVLVLDPTKVL